MFAPYNIPNALVEGVDVLVNKQKSAAYRAPGSPAAAFAAEQAIDELARELDIDPIELRLINTSKEGTRQVAGPRSNPAHRNPRRFWRLRREHPHVQTKLEGKATGRCCGWCVVQWIPDPASAVASINPDGTVSLIEAHRT